MSSPRFSIQAMLVVVFFAALWGILWWHLSGEWSVNDQYSYGWFVPLFAIVLFWLRWEDRPKADQSDQRSAVSDQRTNNEQRITNNSKARLIAIGIMIVALLFLFPMRIFEIGNPDWRPLSWLHALCMVAITLVFLWSVGGASWLRHFAFPVAFTLIAVPWISPIEQPIVQGLMRIVAIISSETVALFGIPARLEGHLIRLPDGLVGVNEACSGVRSLQTSLMIGLLFGELWRLRKNSRAPIISGLSISRRIILLGAAVAIAFLGNCVRAFFLVWVAATKNIAAANQWHDFAGYGIVAAVFLGSLLVAILLGRNRSRLLVNSYPAETNNRELTTNNSAANGFSSVTPAILICAAAWLIAVEFAAASWFRAHERNLAQSIRWEVQWPLSAANFHEIKVDEDMRRILRFDQGRAASWSLAATNSTDGPSPAGKPLNCTVYFFRWDSGKNSALLANLHRPDVCLPSIGWNQTGDAGVKKYPVTQDLALPFRHFKFRHGAREQPTQQMAHAFYCLWEDRVASARSESQLPEMTSAPSAWTRNERMRAVLEGRRHLGQQVMELIIQTRGALEENDVDKEFARLVPEIVKVESRK